MYAYQHPSPQGLGCTAEGPASHLSSGDIMKQAASTGISSSAACLTRRSRVNTSHRLLRRSSQLKLMNVQGRALGLFRSGEKIQSTPTWVAGRPDWPLKGCTTDHYGPLRHSGGPFHYRAPVKSYSCFGLTKSSSIRAARARSNIVKKNWEDDLNCPSLPPSDRLGWRPPRALAGPPASQAWLALCAQKENN